MERQAVAKVQNSRHRVKNHQPKPARSSTAAHPLNDLQQSIGRQAVQRLINSPFIQTKLQVSTPEDHSQKKADPVADSILRLNEPAQDEQLVDAFAGEAGVPIQMKTESDSPARDNDENAIPPLWDAVSSGYMKLLIDIASVNQKIPTVTRSRLGDEISAYASQVGGPGEKTDAELGGFERALREFERRVERLNNDAQSEWGELIDKYQIEKGRLAVLVDERESVLALELLEKEFKSTMARVDQAENFLVQEDLIQLEYMLRTGKHLELGALYAGRREGRPKELSTQEAGSWIGETGDISVSVGATMTSEAGLREIYQKGAREISKAALRDVAKGIPVERAARWAHQARNDLKVLIRSRGSSIVRGFAEARNINKYGNKVGKTYEQMIREGKTPQDVIESSAKANPKVNRVASKLKVGGRLLIALDLAIVTWEIFSAPEGEGLRTGVVGVAGIGGAVGGGWAGAKAGGAVGSIFGPVGTAIGGILGFVGGALIGGWAGRKAAAGVYDFLDELVNPGSEWDEFSSVIDEMENDYFDTQAAAFSAAEESSE